MATLGVAVSLGIAMLCLAALPVTATNFAGTGLYSSYSWGVSQAGTHVGVVVDRTNTSRPRLNAVVVGLLPHIEFSIVGRSVDCEVPTARTNRVFRVRGTTDDNGSAAITRALAGGRPFDSVRSVLIDWGDGSACGATTHFERVRVATGDVNGDAVLGIWDKEDVLTLVEWSSSDVVEVSIMVDGLGGNDVVRFVGVNRSCSQTPNQALFTLDFADGTAGHFATKLVAMTQSGLDSLRAVRVRNMTTGKNLGCYPLASVTDLIIDP